jgi:hypothetical protein
VSWVLDANAAVATAGTRRNERSCDYAVGHANCVPGSVSSKRICCQRFGYLSFTTDTWPMLPMICHLELEDDLVEPVDEDAAGHLVGAHIVTGGAATTIPWPQIVIVIVHRGIAGRPAVDGWAARAQMQIAWCS